MDEEELDVELDVALAVELDEGLDEEVDVVVGEGRPSVGMGRLFDELADDAEGKSPVEGELAAPGSDAGRLEVADETFVTESAAPGGRPPRPEPRSSEPPDRASMASRAVPPSAVTNRRTSAPETPRTAANPAAAMAPVGIRRLAGPGEGPPLGGGPGGPLG
ncbi:MAG: hypothetical protein WC876_02640 [Candidatus Thermoplasmatota archaeon]